MGDDDPPGDGDGEAVGDADGEAVGDGEAVTDGEGDREAVEAGGLLGRGEWLGRGELTVATGRMAGRGPGAGDVDGTEAGRVRGTAGTGGAAADAGEAAALGATLAADDREGGPPSAKLTATDAASRPAVIPAAVTGRHERRPWDRPGGLAGPGSWAGPGEAIASRASPGSQPDTGCPSLAVARTSSAVGRRAGSLARQCPISGRSPAGTSPRSGEP